MSLPNPARQKAARDRLDQIFAHQEVVYAVHYACQSFYSGQQVTSTRVACISLRHVQSGQVTTFSIAKTAELFRMPADAIGDNWNNLERSMLGEFYEFIRMNKGVKLVHWNMRDDTFGFAALEHRFRVLKGRPEEIPEQNRIDLARVLLELYGDTYVKGRAKLKALSRLNKLSMADFLNGADEAQALEAGHLRKVQMSTQTKVKLIADLAIMAHDRTLKVQAGVIAQHGAPARLMMQKLLRNPGYTVTSGMVGGFVVVFKAYDWLFGG
jgi:hypothetical protein